MNSFSLRNGISPKPASPPSFQIGEMAIVHNMDISSALLIQGCPSFIAGIQSPFVDFSALSNLAFKEFLSRKGIPNLSLMSCSDSDSLEKCILQTFPKESILNLTKKRVLI